MSVRINVFIEGYDDQFGLRRWALVPRIGDKMAVELKGAVITLMVKEVVWGVTKASRDGGEAEVSVELEAPSDAQEPADG